MSIVHVDAYGHVAPLVGAAVLAAGAVSTAVVGTIVPTTSAGAAPTVTAVNASDMSGHFTLTAITGGGAQAAGEVAKVLFAQSFRAAPSTVIVTVVDITTATTPVAVPAYATTVTSAGFAVTAPALTTAHAYLVTYAVQP